MHSASLIFSYAEFHNFFATCCLFAIIDPEFFHKRIINLPEFLVIFCRFVLEWNDAVDPHEVSLDLPRQEAWQC